MAEAARGDEWFEGFGESAGDEERGEACSAEGVIVEMGEFRKLPLRWGADESSTSFKSDCRKLGAVLVLSGALRRRDGE